MYMRYFVAGHGEHGEVYSLDKLVVVFHLHSLSREKNGGQRLLDELAGRLLLQYDHWTSGRIGTYHDQFSVKCPGGDSFFLGVGLNTGRLPDNSARVEFNPNKVGSTWELAVVYNACWRLSGGRVTIKQYDLAIDYPVPREDVTLLKDARLYEERRRSASDRTQYVGQRNAPGRCKLYNKQLEQGLDKPLTRLELTIDFEDSAPERAAQYMPAVVSTRGTVQTEMELPRLTDTDLFILTTLAREPERIHELGRRKREALRPWVEVVNQPLRFDTQAYSPVFRALLDFLQPMAEPGSPAFVDVTTVFADETERRQQARNGNGRAAAGDNES